MHDEENSSRMLRLCAHQVSKIPCWQLVGDLHDRYTRAALSVSRMTGAYTLPLVPRKIPC
jgi:hypothetical protein